MPPGVDPQPGKLVLGSSPTAPPTLGAGAGAAGAWNGGRGRSLGGGWGCNLCT